MKKISLFISLTLFTFSLSAKMETKYLQINYSGKGILEEKKLEEHLKSNFKSTDSKYQKLINTFISFLPFSEKSNISNLNCPFIREKPIKIKGIFGVTNRLKEDKQYYQFIAYNFEAIIEVLPLIVRKCKKVLFIKECKNVKVNPSVTQEEIIKFVNKEIIPKVYNNGKVHLPTENYSKFYQIYQKSHSVKILDSLY